IFNRATEGLLTSPDGYSHVARLLNHIAMLTDPRSDDPLSFGKSGFTARKSVIFEILAFYIPRLAKFESADVRVGVARILKHWDNHAAVSDELGKVALGLQKD